MLRFLILCHVCLLIGCSENSTVIRFSVPEDHHVRLPCGGSGGSDVVWTHRSRRVPVNRQGGHETNEDPGRYLLLPDGSLRLLQLDDSDSGEYHCNQRLVAELQVLTDTHNPPVSGGDVTVPAGRTLLLPCSSSRTRQRWFHRRSEGGRREVIFTWFRNGTGRPEGNRLSYDNDALQIQDLQPDDAGEYQCNGRLLTRLTVLTLQPEPTSTQQTSRTTTPAVLQTDVVETNMRRREDALLLVAVVGLAVMIVLLAAIIVLLSSMSCRRRHTAAAASRTRDVTELQPLKTTGGRTDSRVYESPPPPEETIHYASLGRHNWRERPCRTPPDQNQQVIYSSVITRPAAK